MILPPTTVSLEPDTAWTFSERTRVVDVGGWHQGAALDVGQGRVVVFGEAAQFRPGSGRVLFGHNGRFARNVIEWPAVSCSGRGGREREPSLCPRTHPTPRPGMPRALRASGPTG